MDREKIPEQKLSEQQINIVPSEPQNDVSEPSEQDQFQPGQVVAGHYEVVGLIGKGGMGTVYKVRDQFTGRLAAYKGLIANSVKPSAITRFQREATVLCSFTNPHVVAMYDFGISDDEVYLIMELADGESLSAWIEKKGNLDVQTALPLFVQISDALAAAHQNQIIHRDIKPSNVMVVANKDGTMSAKVLDFGIAKITDIEQSRLALTATGEIFGSPLYMSPEQCAGADVDSRSDIYSLGCLMYEALTGSPPLVGTNALQTIHKHAREKPQSFASIRPDLKIPIALEQAIFKALEKNPDDRQQSVAELRDQLKEIELDPNSSQPQNKFRRKTPVTQKKRSWVKTVLACTTIVLAGGVSAAGWFLVDAEHRFQQFEQTGREAREWELKGIACWNRDDWAGAASAYRQCLKMEHNPHVQYELSQALEAQGKLDEAEEAGRAAVDLYQVNSSGPYVDNMKSIAATYANQLGDVLWDKNQYGPALNAYARAAAFTPKDAEFQRNIALKNYTLKRYPTAYQHALKATQLDENSADNWRTLGDVLAAESRFVESAKAYKNATLLDPKDKEAWKGLATALEKQGRHKEAKEAAMRL